MAGPIRELRTKFTADARALQKIFKALQKDASALAKNNGILNKSFKQTNKAADDTTKKFAAADGKVYKLNKTLNQSPKIAKRLDSSMASLNKTADDSVKKFTSADNKVYKLNKTMGQAPKVAKRVDSSINSLNKRINETDIGAKETTKSVDNATKAFSENGKEVSNVVKKFTTADGKVYRLNKSLSQSPKIFSQTGTSIDKMGKNLNLAGAQSVGLTNAIKGTTGQLVVADKGVTKFRQGVRNSFQTMRDFTTNTTKQITNGVNTFRNDVNRSLNGIPAVAQASSNKINNSVRTGIIAPFKEATQVIKGYAAIMGLLSVGGLAKTGMDRLSAIENAQVSLEVMMGDADKATNFLDEVLTFAKTTPFAFPDLAETSRNLIAFGMDAKKVVPTMKAIGDAAAGSGKGREGLNQIASAFGDMQVSGTLSMDQINRLASAGVPALKILANQAGVSVDAMKKDISSGTMSSVKAIDDLVNGMQKGTKGIAGETKAMGGLMEKMKGTWVGSVDSMKSSISNNMAKFMSPLKIPLQNFMAWFGKGFGVMTDSILAFFAMMKPASKPLLQAFKDIYDFIAQSLFPVFKDLFNALKPILSLVGTGMVAAFSMLAKVFKDVIGPALTYITNMKIFAPLLAGIVSYIIAYRSSLIAMMAVQKIHNAITKITIALSKAQRAAHLAMVLSGGGVRGMLLAMNAAMRSLNLTMLKNPIGIVILVLIALGGAFYTLYKKSETFRNGLNKTFDFIKNGSKLALGILIVWIGKAKDALISLGNYFKPVGDALVIGFSKVKDGFAVMARALVKSSDSVKSGFGKVKESFESSFGWIGDVSHKIADVVNKAFEKLGEAFKNFLTPTSLTITSFALLSKRILRLTGPVGIVISVIAGLIKWLITLYKTNEDFRNTVQSSWKGIQDAISAVMKFIEPLINGFKELFMDIAKELAPEFKETGKVIKDSFKSLGPTFSELGGAFSELKEVFGDALKTFGNLVKELVPIWVDFQVMMFETVGELAKEIFPLLFKVVKEVFKAIGDVIKEVMPIIVKLLAEWVKLISDVVKIALPLLMSVVKDILPAILSIIKTVVPIVIQLFTDIIKVVMELVKMALPLILSVVKAVIPVVLSIIKTVIPVIVSIIKVLIEVLVEVIKAVLPALLSIVKAVFPIVEKTIKVAVKVIEIALKAVVAIIKNVLIPTIEFILKIVQIVFPAIAKVIKNAIDIVIGILNFFTALFKGDWKGLWDAVLKILKSAWGIIETVIKAAVKIIWEVIKFAWNNIKNVTSIIFTAIWNFLKSIWEKVSSFISKTVVDIWNKVKEIWTSILNTTKSIFTSVFNAIKSSFSNIWNNVSGATSKIWGGIKNAWNNIKNKTSEVFSGMYNTIKTKFTDMVDLAKGLPKRIGEGIGNMASKVTDGIKKVTDNMYNKLKSGVNAVIGGINWVLEKIGVTPIDEWGEKAKPQPKSRKSIGAQRYAHGTKGHPEDGPAVVGDGTGSNAGRELIRYPSGRMFLSPSIPTLIPDMPKGTEVLSATDTRSLHDLIPKYNNGTNKSKLSYKNIKGVLGFTQKAAKKKAKDSDSKVAKGFYNTMGGTADVAGVSTDLYNQPGETLLKGALKTLGVFRPKGDSFIQQWAKAGYDKVFKGGAKHIEKKRDETGGPVPVGAGANGWRQNIKAAARRMQESITESQLAGIVAQIQRESGGNQKITQSSAVVDINTLMGNPAKGLLQYIPQTFNKYKMKGHGNIFSGFDQLLAFFNNTNWRKDLPYGKSGWGPSGARKYENGGIATYEQLAWLADGGWAESVISHDPAKRASQRGIWEKTGDMLGFSQGKDDKEIISLLSRIARAVENGFDLSGLSIDMDSRTVGKLIEPFISEKQNRDNETLGRFRR